MTSPAEICVVIAAKDAAATIGRAIRSALAEAEVAEVVVVDDGSADGTGAAALAANDGTGRLAVLPLDRNRGPAFARNHAIARSAAPFVAILDADDFFLPGRFRRMLARKDWDLIADNIVFVEGTDPTIDPEAAAFADAPRFLGLSEFVDGNISRRRVQRGEMGFLKPVMRRAFLDRHGLRYREDLRLGEDYELYVRALARGGRYKILHSCGYGAVVRPDSLSGRHRTDDLKRLYEADLAILRSEKLDNWATASLARHARHIAGRHALRAFLDRKSEGGLTAAGLRALKSPRTLPAIVGGVVRDKLDRFTVASPGAAGPRYLLAASPDGPVKMP
ncbi:MAG: glycosyltransferase family 2 protein [Rhizobiaceae bacterium]